MRVIVCGGRDYEDQTTVAEVLRAIALPWDLDDPITLVHGDAPGADRLAAAFWTHSVDGNVESFPADWKRHGKGAGPTRNQQMLDAGADLVIAFPGGRGTADMVDRARKAGVIVLEVSS